MKTRSECLPRSFLIPQRLHNFVSIMLAFCKPLYRVPCRVFAATKSERHAIMEEEWFLQIKRRVRIWIIQLYFVSLQPLNSNCSGFSAVGSAHVWGARGRWFESSNPDKMKTKGVDYQLLLFFSEEVKRSVRNLLTR